MLQRTKQEGTKPRVRLSLRLAAAITLAALTVVAVVLGLLSRSSQLSSQKLASLSSLAVASTNSCPTTSSPQISAWTPTGVVWKLTVTFLSGSRQGQSEHSLMTFSPDGGLTATFPGPTPDSPLALPPALNGRWCMTGINAFQYQFRDPILREGKMVAYIATHIEANLTSKTTFEAGGIGIAYDVATGQPIIGQYNVTQTVAVLSGQE